MSLYLSLGGTKKTSCVGWLCGGLLATFPRGQIAASIFEAVVSFLRNSHTLGFSVSVNSGVEYICIHTLNVLQKIDK